MSDRRHELKTWPSVFREILVGMKTFEVRFHDRDYAVGDILSLEEWDPESETYTGRTVEKRVGYVMYGGRFGLSAEYVIMSLLPCGEEGERGSF